MAVLLAEAGFVSFTNTYAFPRERERNAAPYSALCLPHRSGNQGTAVQVNSLNSSFRPAWGLAYRAARPVAPERSHASHALPATVSQLPSLEATEAKPVFGPDGSLHGFPASPGVYAVYDKEGVLQYMGLSRRVAASVQVHAETVPDLCSSVKVAVVDASNRDALTAAWKAWMEEHVAATGAVPRGNEAGNSSWSSKTQRRTKPEIRLTPGAHVQLNVPLSELIEKVVQEFKVVAFIKGTRTAPQCGFSHKVLTILNDLRVDYETLDVLDEEHNPGLREALKAYSQWPTIPQLYVDGEFVGGADILEEMATSGELKKVLVR